MDAHIGTVQLFAFDFAPVGWRTCDGAVLKIVEHQALFSLIGDRFGGNGRSTFGLPDLRDAAPAEGLTYCINTAGMYPTRG